MGSIERLSTKLLNDTPTLTEDAQLLLDEIDDLIGGGRHRFAEQTLQGIGEVIRRTGTVTIGQHRAVENIRAGTQQGQRTGGNWKRRYEGHR
jgi:hypothetical protein